MTYRITSYTRARARAIGVSVKVAKNQKKKLDVFRAGKKVATIGARGMGDYPTFIRTKGREFANKRRKAYKSRMAKNRKIVRSNGWYADKLLW
jgi:hypothetical protein